MSVRARRKHRPPVQRPPRLWIRAAVITLFAAVTLVWIGAVVVLIAKTPVIVRPPTSMVGVPA